MSQFTYYADLVGIGSLYAASPEQAYQKLNVYYNEVFNGLSAFYRGKPERHVEMFSDSIVIWGGNDVQEFITMIAPIYMTLLSKGLLLRGGIVYGQLKFDVRLTTENFRKNLPDSDVLARCVSLERKVKGARLVIEKEIARDFLKTKKDWLTLDGYYGDRCMGDTSLAIQRSIIPLPDGAAYELLYPVTAISDTQTIDRRIEEMDYLIEALPHDVSVHHAETKRLLKHSKRRLNEHHGRAGA